MDNHFCLRTAGVYVGKFPQPMSLHKLQKKKNEAYVIKNVHLLLKSRPGIGNGLNKTDENNLHQVFLIASTHLLSLLEVLSLFFVVLVFL